MTQQPHLIGSVGRDRLHDMERDVEFAPLLSLLERKRQALTADGQETDAFRLVDGDGDGWPGLWIDVLGRHWVVQGKQGELPSGWLKTVDAGLCDSLWFKQLDREVKAAPKCMAGSAPKSFCVTENDLHFEIQPEAGYSNGLFIDQRDNRRRVRLQLSSGQHVLNLFAYTCSFSVAAAAAGARVTSVDLNAGYLEWGKRNFLLNDLDPAVHHWIKGDSFDWLAAFAKKNRLFNGVIVDPPTFSRGTRKKVFRVESDLAELVSLAGAVVKDGGWLFVSVNTHRLDFTHFEQVIHEGMSRVGRRVGKLERVRMPVDFTGQSYLKCLWLTDVRNR